MHTHFSERPSHVRTFEMIETQSLRRRMEAAIETLIATLDSLDGDSDFEPANDDEDGADRESEEAEYGVAHGDAVFDGSGKALAAALLQHRGIAR